MKDWTIRQRILVSFAVLLVLMVVIAGLAYTRFARIRQEATYVQTRAVPNLYYGTQVTAAHYLNYLLTQEYVLHEDAAGKQKQLKEIAASRSLLQDLMSKIEGTIDTTKDRDLFNVFREGQDRYRRIQDDLLKNNPDYKSNRDAALKIAAELDPEFEKNQALIRTAVDFNKREAEAQTDQILTAVSTAESGLFLSFAATVIVASLCGYFLLTAVTEPLGQLSSQLEDAGLRVNTSLTEIAATAKQQQVMATEVATTTHEIGATSKQISATSKELVRTMDDVSKVADQSAALAGSGQADLTHMEETMHQVISAAGSVNAKLAVLNEKAGNIGQVVTTITKVADQTNLLSLNAAIEAEKAGESGRGFAVVATEIRRLADQTAVATYDIGQMVKEIQSAVSAGVMSMDKFSEEVRRGMQAIEQIGTQLSQIIQQVQALAPRIESVNEGMQAQTTGAEQITEALMQLCSAAEHTVESLRQSNQAIDELQQVSSSLSADVSRFKSKVA